MSTAATLVEINALKIRIERHQQLFQQNLDAITEEARKANDSNAAQFAAINASLAAIIASLKPPASVATKIDPGASSEGNVAE